MDSYAIIGKTQKGIEEIQHRNHGLERELRYVLIMVDGKSSVQQLLEGKGALLPDLQRSLERLLDEGYITIGGSGADEQQPEAAQENGSSSPRMALFTVAREVLGSNADMVVSELAKGSDDPDDLRDLVKACGKVIRLLIDEKKAEVFMTRCQDVLQAG